MSVRKYNPTTNARRISSVDSFEDVTKFEPEKKLTIAKKQMAGRSHGKIAVRHRGGGAKRRIRVVDFRRDKYDVPAKVTAIEYDPGRGARLALLQYADGEKRYMVAPLGLKVGATVISSQQKGDVQDGNRFRLENIPVGMNVHDVEIQAGKGGQLVRGAGVGARRE